MKDDAKIIEEFEHWTQNDENDVCYIPLNLCKDVLKLIKRQQEDYESLYDELTERNCSCGDW